MRELGVFQTLMGEVERYFNKELTDNQSRFYWHECGNWTPHDFERGIKELMRTKRPIPSNFPTPLEINQIIAAMGARSGYREEHPRTRCHSCYDTGYLDIQCRRKDYYWAEVAMCGHCENWKNEDLVSPGYKGAGIAWKSKAVPRFTIEEFDNEIRDRYRRKGIEAKLIRKLDLDKLRRERDKKFGLKEGMTVDVCEEKERAVLNPVADGNYTVGKGV